MRWSVERRRKARSSSALSETLWQEGSEVEGVEAGGLLCFKDVPFDARYRR